MRLGLGSRIALIAVALAGFGEENRTTRVAEPCECVRISAEGAAQIARQQYPKAEETYRRALAAARAERHEARVCKSFNNLGAAELYQFKYREALGNFVKAREAARSIGEREVEAGAWLNLANMYTTLGAGQAAEYAMGEAIRLMPRTSAYIPKLMSQRVRVALRRGDHERALGLWKDALMAAEFAGDHQTERDLWDVLAMMRLQDGDLEGADEALANEFRLVVLHKLKSRDFLYARMGRLRLAQSRTAEAVEWFERARREQKSAASPAIPWVLAQERAAALAASGRAKQAVEAFREAWKMAMAWRQDVLPAQSADLAADVSLAGLSEQFASLSLTSLPAGEAGGVSAEAWAAIEQGRAAGLRRMAMRRQATLRRLDSGYTRLLASLRQALLEGNASARATLAAKLTELEARAGAGAVAQPPGGAWDSRGLIRKLQASMGRDEALFTFLVAEPRSWVWALTREGLVWAPLPGRTQLKASVDYFRQSVLENRADLDGRARGVFRMLFGGLPASVLAKAQWSISEDDVLFECPFAALRDVNASGSPFLFEAHVLKVVPSALWLLQPGHVPRSKQLLAVGDAIHNAADPRFRLSQPAAAPLSFWVMPWRNTRPALPDTLELPTLAGSRVELRQIGELWRGAQRPIELLTGAGASLDRLEAALRARPAFVHFATHVVPAPPGDDPFLVRLRAEEAARPGLVSASTPGDPYLTLSINPEGYREGISAETLAACETPGAVVVLNGCSTGRGKVLPGAGLSGFTSAWLAAGARSVVASLWPVEDDSGEFFAGYYRSILNGRSPADALRQAQLAVLRQGGWRSEPRYWSAYLSIGKE